jgi:hypothetical protein
VPFFWECSRVRSRAFTLTLGEVCFLMSAILVLLGVGVLMGRMFAQPVPQLPLPEAGPAPTATITA